MPRYGDAPPDFVRRPVPARPFERSDYDFLEKLWARTGDAGAGTLLAWLATRYLRLLDADPGVFLVGLAFGAAVAAWAARADVRLRARGPRLGLARLDGDAGGRVGGLQAARPTAPPPPPPPPRRPRGRRVSRHTPSTALRTRPSLSGHTILPGDPAASAAHADR